MCFLSKVIILIGNNIGDLITWQYEVNPINTSRTEMPFNNVAHGHAKTVNNTHTLKNEVRLPKASEINHRQGTSVPNKLQFVKIVLHGVQVIGRELLPPIPE